MMMEDKLGDKPIEDKHYLMMKNLAHTLDGAFNGGAEYTMGFILMVFPLDGHEGRCNYISNASRDDVVLMLREQLARFTEQTAQMRTRQ